MRSDRTRRAFLAFAVGSMLAALVGVARAEEVATRPRLVVEQTEVDLGTREPGPTLEFVFHLKNAGTAPLKVTEVRPSCGCVVAQYEGEIPPGGTQAVSATFNSASYQGLIMKQLMVSSNDPDHPIFPLTLKVTLQPSIVIEPGADLQMILPRGKGAEEIVTVRSTESAPIEISRVDSSATFVKAEVLPVSGSCSAAAEKASSVRKVRIAVEAGATTAPFVATVTLHTNSVAHPELVINVHGGPEDALMVSPPHLYLDQIPTQPSRDTPVSRILTISKRSGSFQILGVEADAALRVTTTGTTKGDFYQVVVRYEGGWKPGPVKGAIVLKTSDPDRPRVEIPYTGEVLP